MKEARIKEIPFTIPFTVYYAVQEPADPSAAMPLLLTLHGWGQRCAPFLRDFAPFKESGVLVVAPQAPHQFYVDTASKKVGCNWLTVYQREQSIQDSNNYLASLVEKIKGEFSLDETAPVFLMGFSQGVSMAYRLAVSGLLNPAGLIACGADIAPDAVEQFPNTKPFPVLLAHGKEDELVPELTLEMNQTILRDAHFPYEVFHYDGGHEITAQLCDKIARWIAEKTQG